MNLDKLLLWSMALYGFLCLASCEKDSNEQTQADTRETMYQVATLQSLMVGNYDGFVSMNELKKHGDIGLGTFNKADGEMIVMDGTIYQALGDGTVKVAKDSETTPFATVTFFDTDLTATIPSTDSISTLTKRLDEIVSGYGRNFIYVLRMDVKTKQVTFRSELPQEKPYGPLVKVLPDKQRTFYGNDLNGTIIAVYFPTFFTGMNTPGWHFHFISDDKKQGGHLFQIATDGASTAHLDATPYFEMYLPEDSTFSQCDLSDDRSEDIKNIEQ